MKATYKGRELLEAIGGLSENSLRILNAIHYEGDQTTDDLTHLVELNRPATLLAVSSLIERGLIAIGDEQLVK